MLSFNESRRLGIGGSDVAAIMGLSPWKTSLATYFEKVRGDTTPDNKILIRGRMLEKYALEAYCAESGVEVDSPLPTIQSKELPYLIANIDARVKGANVLVEAKSAGCYSSQWNDEIPIYYRTQVAYYAMITDCDRVDVAVLFDRLEYRCFSYQRDLSFEKSIKDACVRFWEENVLKTIPPQPENIDDARSLFSISQEKSREATLQAKEAVEEIKKIHFLQGALQKKEENLKLKIMVEMQDAESLVDNGVSLVTWKNQMSARIDSTRLKKENITIYNKFLKETSSRVFRLKGEKA